MSASRVAQSPAAEIHPEPPPIPAHMLEGAEPPIPLPETALALPKWRDLQTRAGQFQAAGGLLLAFVYAYAAVHIAGATAEPS
jgi:hypothetical protein